MSLRYGSYAWGAKVITYRGFRKSVGNDTKRRQVVIVTI